MPTELTIHGVSDALVRQLVTEAGRRGTSINALALEILQTAVGTDGRRQRLDRYMTWSNIDREEFESSLRTQRVVEL